MLAETWHLISLLLAVVSASLQIASILSPLWIWLEDNDEQVGVSLFYRIGLENDGIVNVPQDMLKIKFDSDDTLDSDHWEIMSAMEVTSAFLVIILIPLILMYYHRFNSDRDIKTLYRFSLWISIFSWLFNLIGLILFLAYHGDVLTKGPSVSNTSFSWSGLMSCIALVLDVIITFIVLTRFQDGSIKAIPASADPRMEALSSTKNGTTNKFFHSYYSDTPAIKSNNNSQSALPEVPQRPAVMPRQHFEDRRDIAVERSRSPPMITNNPSRNNNRSSDQLERFQPVLRELDARRSFSDSVDRRDYRNLSEYHGLVGDNVDVDPRDFVHSPPRREELPKQTRTMVLERHDQLDGLNQGFEENMMVNSYWSGDQRRNSNTLELPSRNAVRKQSGDFLVTAKHGAERDVHRDNARYLSHTSKPTDSTNQRLALSPSNFLESNVRYNPSFMYRPYSEMVH